MNVIVDTCIWSEAFRKTRNSSPIAQYLLNLLDRDEAGMLGAVRQEVLSGIREYDRYLWLKELLQAIPDLPVLSGDYEMAAEFFNKCRASGVQASNTDFLMCAASVRVKAVIFTTDKDFQHIAKVIPIHLHRPN